MWASKGEGPSEADLLAVVRGADEQAAQAAFQELWQRHAASVSRFVRAKEPNDVKAPVKRSAVFGAWRAKWLHKSKT
ncbi:MAG TPA: hypothetical protein VGR57_14000 [Ktedonobacterales bacterium]|nr:hypothetical protein [Ktedonobacterales bacterium]